MSKSHLNCVDCFHLKAKPFITNPFPETSTGEVYLNLNRDTKIWCELGNWRKLKSQYPKEINIRRFDQITLRSLKERSSVYEVIADACKDYDGDEI